MTKFLFDRYAKLLFLVNDKQSQVFKLHVFTQNTMSTYKDIHFTCLHPFEDGLHLGGSTCTAQILHSAGHPLQSLAEGLKVLIGQYSSWHQYGHLLIVGHGLEGRTNSYLGFAESYVTTNQPVHGPTTLHIRFDSCRSLALVWGIFIEKTGLQLVLHETVGAEGKSLLLLALGVKANQVASDILDFCLSPIFQFLPGTSTQFVESRHLSLFAFVLRHLMERMDRDKHHIVVLIDQFHHLLGSVAIGHAHQPGKATYTMVRMHHIVARSKLIQFLQREGHLAAACLITA